MEKDKILEQLKEYFPSNLSVVDGFENYVKSEEYLKRRSRIDLALSDFELRDSFKNSLGKIAERVSEYSFAGGSSCYHFSFAQSTDEGRAIYSVFISVLLPYYTIRCLKKIEKYFHPISETDFNVFKEANFLVQKFFPEYQLIDDESFLNKVMPNFGTEYIENPTILDLLFSTIET